MKKFPLPSTLIVYALRGTLFLAAGLVLAQPCAGSFGLFENTSTLATARYAHTATLLDNGKVLVTGGLVTRVTALTSAELYDPANQSWTSASSLGAARAYHTATKLNNGKVLVTGGVDSGNNPLTSAELYDPMNNGWTAAGSLGTPRAYHTATLLLNGKVLITGGNNLPSAELYDPANGSWTPAASPSFARQSHTATLLDNGKVLVAAGVSPSGTTLASAELYDPAVGMSGSWLTTANLGTERFGHTATRLLNGQVLIAGGDRTSPVGSIERAELYDPVSSSWMTTGSLSAVRQAHTATLLPDGQVLVAAGVQSNTGNQYLASAELYNPANGRWTATGSLTAARALHTATKLNNGTVLVTGGVDGGDVGTSHSLASAELYVSARPVIKSPLNVVATRSLPFTYQFETIGATSIAVALPLPAGLVFDMNLSAITGVPTTAGTFQVALIATNSTGQTPAMLTITVQPFPPSPPSALLIISSTAVTGRTGRPFAFQLQAVNGSSATHFAVDPGSALPPGLDLDLPTGFISGTPTSDGYFILAVSAIDGEAIAHATLQLTFTSDLNFPIITSPVISVLTPGQFFTYTITSEPDATYSYMGTDGIVHREQSCDGLPAGLCFDGRDTIWGVFTGGLGPISRVKNEATDRNVPGGSKTIPLLEGVEAGEAGIVTNVQFFATNDDGTGTFSWVTFIGAQDTINISTRLNVGTGDNALIAGFIINGTGTTRALIRAIGPSLVQFGIANALQDPILELRDGAGALLHSNDDWRESQENPIIALTAPADPSLAPRDDHESAILAFLSPGAYTAVVRGKNNTTGVALVEVYDLGIAYPERLQPVAELSNISTRGFVDTGDNVMIGGFIILPRAPATSTRVLIRGIGPFLTQFGVANALADPTLELRNSQGGLLMANNNWQDDQAQAAQLIAAGLAPTNPLESGIAATPSADPVQGTGYTVILRGQSNITGVALVEVYALP